MNALPNILAIARREFTVRARTRSFRLGTIVLVLGIVALAFVPVVGRYLDLGSSQRIGLYVTATDVAVDPASTLGAVLNAPASATDTPTESPYEVVTVADLGAARAQVGEGRLSAVLAIERAPSGDLRFSFYADEPNGIGAARTAALLRQASGSIEIADRLERLGVAPADQSSLLSPPVFEVVPADPTKAALNAADEATSYILGFGMTVLIFMMVILYGTWVAMSVVEEKSSRVMEVVLNAATPFQLLSGKVFGVGAVALTQYGAIVATGVIALLAQGPVASAVSTRR